MPARRSAVLPNLDRNGRLVVAAKGARAFAFGLNSVGLGLFLAEIGLTGQAVGVILAAAMAGNAAFTLVIALWGDRIGRRRVLIAGSLLMLLAIAIPAAGPQPVLLALVAFTGMVSVTANESTGLVSVDQSILPQSVPERERTKAFATYGLVAFVASAIGSASLGPLVGLADALGLAGADRFGPTFVAYAAVGLVSAAFAMRLDGRAELGQPLERGFAIRRSRRTVAGLSALFALDSFASGFAVQSFVAFWFASRHALDPGSIGLLFFAGSLLAAASFPAAAALAGRIGLIRTMVFTHIPANGFLIAMAFVPVGAAPVAAALYLARALLSTMDVPARQSYVMAVVDPAERTATAGVTSLARSISQAAGPLVGGALLVPLGIGVPLVAAGALKATYDVLLFIAFRSRPAPGEAAHRRDGEPVAMPPADAAG
ncbi:MAG TPA: MFS transporter [Candidatus Limnocylindrales bacterium]|nr:MFS transporter [Candidatus Limnocylindrales bacterium]